MTDLKKSEFTTRVKNMIEYFYPYSTWHFQYNLKERKKHLRWFTYEKLKTRPSMYRRTNFNNP